MPLYRQLTLLTFEELSCGSAGVSQILSPALAQLVPVTSSSVRIPFVTPCVCSKLKWCPNSCASVWFTAWN